MIGGSFSARNQHAAGQEEVYFDTRDHICLQKLLTLLLQARLDVQLQLFRCFKQCHFPTDVEYLKLLAIHVVRMDDAVRWNLISADWRAMYV